MPRAWKGRISSFLKRKSRDPEGSKEEKDGYGERRRKRKKIQLTRRQPPNPLPDSTNRRSESTDNIALAELANTIPETARDARDGIADALGGAGDGGARAAGEGGTDVVSEALCLFLRGEVN